MSTSKPHHVLLIAGGKGQHIAENTRLIESDLIRAGMTVATSDEPSSVDSLASGKTSAVVVLTQGERFDAAQCATLEKFLRAGGGLVGVHSAAAVERDQPFAQILGCRFASIGPLFEYQVA